MHTENPSSGLSVHRSKATWFFVRLFVAFETVLTPIVMGVGIQVFSDSKGRYLNNVRIALPSLSS